MADQTDTTATETSTTDTGGTSDAGTTQAPAAVDTSGSTDDTTVLGSATTDTGTGDTKAADSKEPPSPTPVPDDAGVPEAYELKLTSKNEAGEDVSTDLDSSLVEIATPLLREAKLSNEQANKLLPLVPQIQERVLSQMNDEFAATRADWAKQAREDPEIGGKNWDETVQLSAKALDHFTGPAGDTNGFRKLLNDSGLGNHPDMIRAFRKIGASLAEDNTMVRNTVTTEVPKSREEILYPNDVPKT